KRAGSSERCRHADLLLKRAAISPAILRLEEKAPRPIPIQPLWWAWPMHLGNPRQPRVPMSTAFLQEHEKYGAPLLNTLFQCARRFWSCSGSTIGYFFLGIQGLGLCLKTQWKTELLSKL